VRPFDQKFGADFLASVPAAPGVYRFYDVAGTVLYVGKANNLRRRLGQYRTAGRKKKEKKRRTLVKAATRIGWDVSESALAAELTEIRLIQRLRPPRNVASAFPFLYPFIGLHADAGETYFCLTTSPGAFPAFDLHGAFRSRDVTGEAFFSLMRLLGLVGHPVPRHRCKGLVTAAHSHVVGFRRLPADAPDLWGRLLRGVSREALEALALRLIEHAGALARRAEIQEDLRAVSRFFETEASSLARARTLTGYSRYPVPQEERDLLFAQYRREGAPDPGHTTSSLTGSSDALYHET
jgi:excinuclease ABC subunit C